MKYLQLFISCFISLTLTKSDPEPLDTINLNLNSPYEKPDGIQRSKLKEMFYYRRMASHYGNNGNNNGYGYVKNGIKDIGYKNGYLKKYCRYGRYCRYGKKATKPAPIITPVPTATPAHESSLASGYCQIHPRHTMCIYSGPSAACAAKTISRKISPKDQDAILDKHNELRRRVAKGLETQGRPGPQPAASDMVLMVWDDELATIAQRWADQCPTLPNIHDPLNTRDTNEGYVGQNIGNSWSNAPLRDSYRSHRYIQSIEEMYQEVQHFSRNSINPWVPNPGFTPRYAKTGHYTQIVWGASRKVGCGSVFYDNGPWAGGRRYMSTFICNYYIGGNWRGRTMYSPGRACSACPAQYPTCSDALCTT